MWTVKSISMKWAMAPPPMSWSVPTARMTNDPGFHATINWNRWWIPTKAVVGPVVGSAVGSVGVLSLKLLPRPPPLHLTSTVNRVNICCCRPTPFRPNFDAVFAILLLLQNQNCPPGRSATSCFASNAYCRPLCVSEIIIHMKHMLILYSLCNLEYRYKIIKIHVLGSLWALYLYEQFFVIFIFCRGLTLPFTVNANTFFFFHCLTFARPTQHLPRHPPTLGPRCFDRCRNQPTRAVGHVVQRTLAVRS